jgi:hypothetical protein
MAPHRQSMIPASRLSGLKSADGTVSLLQRHGGLHTLDG